jgi:hypothetical protein
VIRLATDPDVVQEYAFEAARRTGCTCEPDITVTELPGVWQASVAHDDDCQLCSTPD